MKKTYTGSCHCGAVKFEADLDLAAGTKRCNCTFCLKSRIWKVFALKGDFRLLEGEESLTDYQTSSDGHHFYFCKRCGMRPFVEGCLEMAPFNGKFHAVNVASFDNVTDEEFAQVPIQYEDGRNDNWECAPKITSYL